MSDKQYLCFCLRFPENRTRHAQAITAIRKLTLCCCHFVDTSGPVRIILRFVSFLSDTSRSVGYILRFFVIVVGHINVRTHLDMPDISSRNRPYR